MLKEKGHSGSRLSKTGLTLLAVVSAACSAGNTSVPSECSLDAQLSALSSEARKKPYALLACPELDRSRAGGPLRVTVALANLTDSLLRVRPNFVFGAWLNAEIIGPQGTPLKMDGNVDAGLGEIQFLLPGRRIEAEVDLTCSFKVPDEEREDGSCVSPYDLEVPGDYAISISYAIPCDIEGCWAGSERIEMLWAEPFKVTRFKAWLPERERPVGIPVPSPRR